MTNDVAPHQVQELGLHNSCVWQRLQMKIKAELRQGAPKGGSRIKTLRMQLPCHHLAQQYFWNKRSAELTELMHEVLDLVSDHDVYWQVQGVIKGKAKLLVARSAFLTMMNDSFAYAATVRIRRIVDGDPRTISLLGLLKQLARYPTLLDGRITAAALQTDISELEEATK